MPNWCNNDIVIRGSVEQINAIEAGLSNPDKEKKAFFNVIRPQPDNIFLDNLGETERKECAEQNIPNWYDWNLENWGTKWEASVYDWTRVDDTSISVSFDTAWSPPSNLYEYMANNGYTFEAYYLEEGMGFVGKTVCEGDEDYYDDYYDYGGNEFNSETIRDYIGEDLDDHWNISERMADWERENEEYEDEEEDEVK